MVSRSLTSLFSGESAHLLAWIEMTSFALVAAERRGREDMIPALAGI
jgi:hypothetical protein